MTNSKYGRIVNGAIVYAPAQIVSGNSVTTNPTASQYLAAGYYPLAHNQPLEPATAGYHWEHANWQVVDGAIVEDFTQVADPPVVHTYSKLRLYLALFRRSLWVAFRAWLVERGYADAWELAQELSTDYDGWDAIAADAQVALGVDAETLAAILAEAEVGNG